MKIAYYSKLSPPYLYAFIKYGKRKVLITGVGFCNGTGYDFFSSPSLRTIQISMELMMFCQRM